MAWASQGYLSLVPEPSMGNDEIWTLQGGQVLYVLRRQPKEEGIASKSTHTFIGEAYVHGLMDGQAHDIAKEVENVILA